MRTDTKSHTITEHLACVL